MYSDLSILPEKAIDVAFLLKKLQSDGYSAFALDYEFSDEKIFKPNPNQRPKVEGIHIATRATFILENSASLHPLNQQTVPYDLIAIKPMNEKMFHSVCIESDAYDIITFDLSQKLPFMLKRNPVYEAIRKGKYFEICYDSMFSEAKRIICMTNMSNIIKATGGKNLIVSSHAFDHSTHRTPFDVIALLGSLGLQKSKAIQCIKENCEAVVKNSQHRKFYKGIIKQIPISFGIKLNKRIQKHRQGLKLMQKKRLLQGEDEKQRGMQQ